MSSPKSPLSTELKVPCISCGKECPDGLRYCIYCGGKTLEIDRPAMPMNPHCAECGQTDELNLTFCVVCGAKLLSLIDSVEGGRAGSGAGADASPLAVGKASKSAGKRAEKVIGKTEKGAGKGDASLGAAERAKGSSQGTGQSVSQVPDVWSEAGAGVPAGARKFKRNTGFNWTTELAAPKGHEATKIAEDLRAPKVASQSLPGFLPIIVGSAAGLLISAGLFLAGVLPDLFERAVWPASGLIVYCPMEELNSAASGLSDASGQGSTNKSESSAAAENSGAPQGKGTEDNSGAAGSGNPAVANSGSAGNTGSVAIWQLSLENLSNHQLTVSPIAPPRSSLGRRLPGCLVLKDLPAGEYMLRILREGKTMTLGSVTLVADRPTVIGYPGGLKPPM
jgi:hypothetical protein